MTKIVATEANKTIPASRSNAASFMASHLGLYVLLKPLRAFVTVKDPSCCADTLIQYAGPL